MVKYSLLFLVLLVTTTYAQIGGGGSVIGGGGDEDIVGGGGGVIGGGGGVIGGGGGVIGGDEDIIGGGEGEGGDVGLLFTRWGGVLQLYATDAVDTDAFDADAVGNAIDIDVTNGSNLLINGDSVATQLYADAGDDAILEDLRTSWADSTTEVSALGAADLSAVEAQITNLDTYIANEGQYRSQLAGANAANDIQITLEQANFDSATASAASAATALNDATIALGNAQQHLQMLLIIMVPITPEIEAQIAAAEQAVADAVAAQATAVIINANAQAALADAETSLNEANDRKAAIEASIARSDGRVAAALAAQVTIQAAIDAKVASFEGIYDAIAQYGEGIFDTDGSVNVLDDIITTLDAVVGDDDGLDYDPEPPVWVLGVDTTTAYLENLANDPIAVDRYIAEAYAALASITAPITTAEQDGLLDTIGNGAFERQAITEIATNGIEGIITQEVDGSIHIGENSLITNEVGGVQELYAQDAGAAAIDIDVTNGSNLLINGAAVATQTDIDQNELDSDAANAALQAYSDNADVMLQEEIFVNAAVIQADIATLNNTVFSTTLEAGEVGIAGVITKNASGEVHIGENSLVTAEVGGVQQLYATDAGSNAIDIDITNGSNLLINGDPVATQLYADQAEVDAVTTAQAYDAVIQADLNQAIVIEAQTRADADGMLDMNIVSTTQYVDLLASSFLSTSTDADAAIQADVDANELASDDADAALAAASDAADANLQQQINNLQSYVDSAVAQARADGVTAGIQSVTSDPQSYQLYSESSIMEMNVSNPTLSMLNESEQAQVEFTLETSTDLEDWNIEERIQRTIEATGDKFFVRIKSGVPYVTPAVLVFNHPSYGEILTDQSGNVLYGFSIDSVGGDPIYIGAAWPLALQIADPEPDAGVSAALTSGTFSNASGGPWLKINNRPVYTYASDSEPNQASGHGLGFVWFTIKPDGTLNQ